MQIKVGNLEHKNAERAKANKGPLENDVVLETKDFVKAKRTYAAYFVGRDGYEIVNHTALSYPEYKPGDIVHVKDANLEHWNDFVIKEKKPDVLHEDKGSDHAEKGMVPVYECWPVDQVLQPVKDTTLTVKAFDIRTKKWRDRLLDSLGWEKQINMNVKFAQEDLVWCRAQPLYKKAATSATSEKTKKKTKRKTTKKATKKKQSTKKKANKRKAKIQATNGKRAKNSTDGGKQMAANVMLAISATSQNSSATSDVGKSSTLAPDEDSATTLLGHMGKKILTEIRKFLLKPNTGNTGMPPLALRSRRLLTEEIRKVFEEYEVAEAGKFAKSKYNLRVSVRRRGGSQSKLLKPRCEIYVPGKLRNKFSEDNKHRMYMYLNPSWAPNVGDRHGGNLTYVKFVQQKLDDEFNHKPVDQKGKLLDEGFDAMNAKPGILHPIAQDIYQSWRVYNLKDVQNAAAEEEEKDGNVVTQADLAEFATTINITAADYDNENEEEEGEIGEGNEDEIHEVSSFPSPEAHGVPPDGAQLASDESKDESGDE